MKYLLQALEARPGSTSLGKEELRKLLHDVHDGTNTRGMDDWYESLDKIIHELKSTPSCHWFLKPVSKKDVKDYHTIVHHPMDFQTLQKKVKTKQYRTKEEFKDDIDLIWSNALLYNTSPEHPVRLDAISMKRKADHHLEFLIGPPSKHEKKAALDLEIENQQQIAEASAREAQREKERRLKGKGKLEDSEVAWWASAYADDTLGAEVPLVVPMAKPRKRAKILEPTTNGRNNQQSTSHHATFKPPILAPPSSSALASTSTSAQPSNSLATLIQGNISTLRHLRRSHAKLAALDAQHFEPTEEKRTTFHPMERSMDEDDEMVFAPLVDASATCGDVPPDVALDGLRKVTGTLLAHAGFDGGNQSSVETLTHLASQYISNLGKTLRFYIDNHGQSMSSEEMILHTLFESGVPEIRTLDRHVREDVKRYGTKISDVARKMDTVLKESTLGAALEDDMLFAGDGEMFMSNFTEELGEDFFGFKELGLDKEGLSTFSVPDRLLHGRTKSRNPRDNVGPREPVPDFPPPPPYVPFTKEEIPSQIGLLRSFYTERSQQPDGLADDMFNPVLLKKLGPFGQPPSTHPTSSTAAAAKRKLASSTTITNGGPFDGKSTNASNSVPAKKKNKTKTPAEKVPGPGKGNWVRKPKAERDKERALKEAEAAAAAGGVAFAAGKLGGGAYVNGNGVNSGSATAASTANPSPSKDYYGNGSSSHAVNGDRSHKKQNMISVN